MKNSSNVPLTLSQSLKLYMGIRLPVFVLQAAVTAFLMYSASMMMFLLTGIVDNGTVSVQERLAETMTSNLFLVIDFGIGMGIISSLVFEKKMPGGKFFRTVKGGFDTFLKMRTAQMISLVVSLALYLCAAYAVSAAGLIPIKYAGSTCIAVFIFLTLALGINNILSIIKSEMARVLMTVAVIFAAGIIGVFTLDLTEGKLGILHIAAAAAAAVLLPISHKIMLSEYRKNKWDS